MPGKAIGLSMNYGYAGKVSRTNYEVIEAKPVKSNSANINFGEPVVQNTDDTYSSFASVTMTPANFAGVAVAEVKQNTTYTIGTDPGTAGAYTPLQPADVIKAGIVSVQCKRGTPTTGGAVYVRTVLSTSFPSSLVGDFETSSDSGKNILVPNACWANNRIDGNLVAELKLKYANN